MPSLTGLANSLRSDFFPCAGKQSNAKRTASPLTPALSPLRGEGEDFESGRAAIDMPLLRSLGSDHPVWLGQLVSSINRGYFAEGGGDFDDYVQAAQKALGRSIW